MTLSNGVRAQPVLPFLLRHGARRGFEREPAADEQEDERNVPERVRRASRPGGRRRGWAAPLPNELRSLGYPATNIPRGKPHRSNPPFGTPLPEEMRSLGYPTKKNLRGTILETKGIPAKTGVPFFMRKRHLWKSGMKAAQPAKVFRISPYSY